MGTMGKGEGKGTGKGQGGDIGNGSIFLPAMGNLHGQYNFQSIAIAMVIMKDAYPQTRLENAACLSVVFAGAVFGQLAFGYIGDWGGRNRAMFLTNLFCVIGAFGSAVITSKRSEAVLYGTIAFWRFILGMGVGGNVGLRGHGLHRQGCGPPQARACIMGLFLAGAWLDVAVPRRLAPGRPLSRPH